MGLHIPPPPKRSLRSGPGLLMSRHGHHQGSRTRSWTSAVSCVPCSFKGNIYVTCCYYLLLWFQNGRSRVDHRTMWADIWYAEETRTRTSELFHMCSIFFRWFFISWGIWNRGLSRSGPHAPTLQATPNCSRGWVGPHQSCWPAQIRLHDWNMTYVTMYHSPMDWNMLRSSLRAPSFRYKPRRFHRRPGISRSCTRSGEPILPPRSRIEKTRNSSHI